MRALLGRGFRRTAADLHSDRQKDAREGRVKMLHTTTNDRVSGVSHKYSK